MPLVVVLGSSGYDLTIRLPRLPRPGETLLGGDLLRGPGGKGANAAVAARRAGAEVTFLTAFGDDDFGRLLIEHDRRAGLDLSFAKTVPGVSNQVALIFVGDDGANSIAVAPGASARLGPDDIDALPDAAFPSGGVLLACLEVPVPTVARGLARAKAAGMTTILNPAPADPAILAGDLLRHVDYLTPNQEEAAELSGLPAATIEQAVEAARALRDRGDCGVIVTLGELGCLVLGRQWGQNLVPAPLVDAVDTVGAGDAFNGALAVALAEGRPPLDAAVFACAAGSLAVTKPGAQGALASRADIDRLLAEDAARRTP
ncbi:ribokinase [Tautonia sociabilis]|uniref:Ribokinase n=1 Tax=Tautonia sociabilis TaxID=2080755 RepID=A0A432MDR4_9BACT|nr:ribokinase [Tautonia sociabilis]RUL83083.1 ribokinase [Tautonia sociabilis]